MVIYILIHLVDSLYINRMHSNHFRNFNRFSSIFFFTPPFNCPWRVIWNNCCCHWHHWIIIPTIYLNQGGYDSTSQIFFLFLSEIDAVALNWLPDILVKFKFNDPFLSPESSSVNTRTSGGSIKTSVSLSLSEKLFNKTNISLIFSFLGKKKSTRIHLALPYGHGYIYAYI